MRTSCTDKCLEYILAHRHRHVQSVDFNHYTPWRRKFENEKSFRIVQFAARFPSHLYIFEIRSGRAKQVSMMSSSAQRLRWTYSIHNTIIVPLNNTKILIHSEQKSRNVNIQKDVAKLKSNFFFIRKKNEENQYAIHKLVPVSFYRQQLCACVFFFTSFCHRIKVYVVCMSCIGTVCLRRKISSEIEWKIIRLWKQSNKRKTEIKQLLNTLKKQSSWFALLHVIVHIVMCKIKGLKHTLCLEATYFLSNLQKTEKEFGKIQFKQTTLVTRAFHFQSCDRW